ncbi:hypothetical protein JCM3775_003367 [Rhodotorula graminis]
MESPYPPQLSTLPAPPPPSPAGPSSSSSPSSASAGAQPAPLVSTSAASAEPRQQQQQQQRKRAFTAGGGGDVECAGASAGDEPALAAPGEVAAARRMSASQGVQMDVAHDLGEGSRWQARCASEVRKGRRASLRCGEDPPPPDEKRRRVEYGGERDGESPEPAYRTAPSSSRRRRPRLSHSSSWRSSSSCARATDVAPASLSPSPYLGVFATPFAAVAIAPLPSSTQPPAPSPHLAPASARLAQGAFPAPTSSPVSSPPADGPQPRRRRAYSLPNPADHAALPLSTRPVSSSSTVAITPAPRLTPPSPTRRSGSTSAVAEEDRRQRRSPGPSVGDSLAFGSFAFLSQDDLLALHAARVRAEGGDVPCGSLSAISLAPPVTKTTLRELDLNEILRNPQLRHDVVFDPNLMFRPNYDGERGERKRLLAAQYWTAISREIETGCRCTTFCDDEVRPCICLPTDTTSHGLPLATRLPSRIALLIAELRNIFVSLLPIPVTSAPASPDLSSSSSSTFANSPPSSPDLSSPSSASSPVLTARDQLLDVLDPALLMQQLERGCADIPSLARFLGATVKQHCAPMRDEMVDAMVVACEGEGLAKGLEMCFEILELMKLDIANHQLRSLRPYLVQTALVFERRVYQDFATRRQGPGSFDRLRTWLHSSAAGVVKKDTPRALDSRELVEQALTHGLLDLVFPSGDAASSSPAAALPETLQLDSYRIQAFHSDAVDLAVVYLLTMLFGQLAYPARPTPADLDSLRQELWCIMASSARSPSSLAGPAGSIQGIPQGPPGLGSAKLENPTWRAGMQDVLLQVARRATELRLRATSTTATTSCASSAVPDAETLALVASYFDSNVRESSKLFQLLQRRLRETLHAVVDEELAKEVAHGPMSFTGWWAPQVEPGPMTTGGAQSSAGLAHFAGSSRASSRGARPSADMMASTTPSRGVKRSCLDGGDNTGNSPSSSRTGGLDERQRRRRSSSSSSSSADVESAAQPSLVDLALQRNGLVALSTEVKLLGMRIARVATFNLAVYRPLYTAWLSIPPPSSPSHA